MKRMCDVEHITLSLPVLREHIFSHHQQRMTVYQLLTSFDLCATIVLMDYGRLSTPLPVADVTATGVESTQLG